MRLKMNPSSKSLGPSVPQGVQLHTVRDEAARRDEGACMELADIKNVTVAGGGTQGSQIASQIASKGFHVTVWLRSEGSIDRAPSCSPTPPR